MDACLCSPANEYKYQSWFQRAMGAPETPFLRPPPLKPSPCPKNSFPQRLEQCMLCSALSQTSSHGSCRGHLSWPLLCPSTANTHTVAPSSYSWLPQGVSRPARAVHPCRCTLAAGAVHPCPSRHIANAFHQLERLSPAPSAPKMSPSSVNPCPPPTIAPYGKTSKAV